MKRFILYLLLVPIIGQIVTVVIQAVEYAVMYGSNIFDLLLDPSLYFLWSTSLLWLVPALRTRPRTGFSDPINGSVLE
jgi:hypothetical protein